MKRRPSGKGKILRLNVSKTGDCSGIYGQDVITDLYASRQTRRAVAENRRNGLRCRIPQNLNLSHEYLKIK